jgi:hypothetical protein
VALRTFYLVKPIITDTVNRANSPKRPARQGCIPTREDTMAGRGPAPKDPATRKRRNATIPMTTIADDGTLHGPDLPEGVLPKGDTWHTRTVTWWTTWRRSPQAQTFIATDWDFLIDTALMHHTMWQEGRWEFASELRLRAAKYGATPEDRMRLKLQVETPATPKAAPAAPGKVTDISSRRGRLAG